MTDNAMKPTIPVFLSLNAGYVDTAGFLALHGLFTAHVTGNFVTFGASLVLGTSGAVAKLLALPVFCAVVVGVGLLGLRFSAGQFPIFRALLAINVFLLALAASLAIWLGPFKTGDGWPAIATGMTLVSAMAIQNSVQRVHLSNSPPTTLMTGTTTQIMLDVAHLLHGAMPEAKSVIRARLTRMSANVISFAVGCAAGALGFALFGDWCFLAPPILALPTFFLAMPKSS
jgi:uncharacterized membrane protein YoaK (UPF0700 family)